MFILHAPNLQLPWYSTADEDNRFYKLLKIFVGSFIVLTIAIALIPVPELTREQKETIPPQLAQVILEKKEIPKPPPPPPPVVEEEPEPTPEPEPKPEPEPEPKPEPKPEPEPEPIPEPEPVIDRVAEARDQAATSGLLQFKDDLADMRDALDVSKVDNNNLSRGEATAAEVDRSIITSGTRGTSGGVNTAALSRDTGGVALSGRETTKVESTLATRTGAGDGAAGGANQSSGRGQAEIRQVIERHKGAIFAIYNRALRRDPTLQGRVKIELTIEPNGQISSVKIVSSELNDPELESKIIARFKLISFEPSNASTTVTNYDLSFLPS